MTDTETELTDAEERVHEVVVDEGRVTPRLVAELTGLDAETATAVLDRLVEVDLVAVVTEGLYERRDRPDDDTSRGIPEMNPETQTAPIDPRSVTEEPDDDGS